MPLDPVVLVNIGGWVVFGIAFLRGLLVPRFVYDQEVRRADSFQQDLKHHSDTITTLTETVERLVDEARTRRPPADAPS